MMRRRYGEHIHVFPQIELVYSPGWTYGMMRADGRCLCSFCGKPYDEHPTHPDYPEIPTLVVICDGTPVKT